MMDYLYYIAILIFGGLIFSKILSKFNFPEVTGYLLGGIIIGPSILKLIPSDMVSSLDIINDVALAFIAFSVGNAMNFEGIKKLGPKIFLVTICEALGAMFIVGTGMLLIFDSSLPTALVLGSIACATAPAATLMVIKEYEAKGDLVDVLIPVVALDDAVCIIAFGISSTLAQSILAGTDLNLYMMLGKPVLNILLALVLGIVSGIITILIKKHVKGDNRLISLIIAVVFLDTAIALYFGLSSLLTLMSTGFILANLGGSNRRVQDLVEKITPPIFICFFVLSGADLTLSSIKSVGIIGIYYIIARVLGKMLGAYVSTRAAGFPKSVQNYLGLTLMPQAGVALGLSLVAVRILPSSYGEMIRTIILSATIFYELIGPVVAKFALTKAGCIESQKAFKKHSPEY